MPWSEHTANRTRGRRRSSVSTSASTRATLRVRCGDRARGARAIRAACGARCGRAPRARARRRAAGGRRSTSSQKRCGHHAIARRRRPRCRARRRAAARPGPKRARAVVDEARALGIVDVGRARARRSTSAPRAPSARHALVQRRACERAAGGAAQAVEEIGLARREAREALALVEHHGVAEQPVARRAGSRWRSRPRWCAWSRERRRGTRRTQAPSSRRRASVGAVRGVDQVRAQAVADHEHRHALRASSRVLEVVVDLHQRAAVEVVVEMHRHLVRVDEHHGVGGRLVALRHRRRRCAGRTAPGG